MWLRWSWRDLRARWLQIGAIAGIIAIGSGVYSGLGSTAAWRTTSSSVLAPCARASLATFSGLLLNCG